jgi:serine/threonine protein kinase
VGRGIERSIPAACCPTITPMFVVVPSRYADLVRVGSGGMGDVYRATDTLLRREVAIKVMRPDRRSPEDAARMLREARAAAALRHPNVVVVYDLGEVEGGMYLAMEYLQGEPLREHLGKGDLETRLRWLRETGSALAAAHAVGIVHRDVKPENVFVCHDGTAKVLDFGIAKRIDPDPADPVAATIREPAAADGAVLSFETQAGTVVGTPAYMAPEQRAAGYTTALTDQYAWGVLVWEVLTGMHPATSPANATHAPEDLPPAVAAVAQRAMRPDPRARFADMNEALRALAGEAVPDPADNPAVTAPTPKPKPMRNPTATATATPTLTPNASDPANATLPSHSGPSGRTGFAARLRRRLPPAVVAALLGALAVTFAGAVAVALHQAKTPIARAGPRTEAPTGFPGELGASAGARWFNRVRERCNPVAVNLMEHQDPPPKGKDGAGFMAACLTLAGKHDRARALVDALPKEDRSFAVWAVFEVIHPIADAGDDDSAGPGMLLVIAYWPENYMALYHAGMSEYRSNQPAAAREHLERFLVLYKEPNGFTTSARTVLAELEHPGAPGDCATPLTIDPEGKRVFRLGCKPPT